MLSLYIHPDFSAVSLMYRFALYLTLPCLNISQMARCTYRRETTWQGGTEAFGFCIEAFPKLLLPGDIAPFCLRGPGCNETHQTFGISYGT